MEESVARIVQAISEMSTSVGWAHLRKDFEFQIETLQDEINEPGGNTLLYTEADLKKIKLKILKEIIVYPANFISMAQVEPITEEQDPYKN